MRTTPETTLPVNYSDYYPLFKDMETLQVPGYDQHTEKSEIAADPSSAMTVSHTFLSSGDRAEAANVIRIALANRLPAFQTVVLLIKNLFEGHTFLTEGITAEELFAVGTVRADPETGETAILVYSYYEALDLYIENLNDSWNALKNLSENLEGIDFESLLYFILSNVLWRFPVNCMSGFDIQKFCSPSPRTRAMHRFHFELSKSAFLSQPVFSRIEVVNKQYDNRFRTQLHKIQSREQVIKRLNSKLSLAYDPAVKSVQDLERKYLDFLITADLNTGDPYRRNSARGQEIPVKNDDSSTSEFRVRQLYRSIAKNCRETHTSTESRDSVMDSFFMNASRVYNQKACEPCELLIQQFELLDILARVVNYRVSLGLTVSFPDYTSGKPVYRHSYPDKDYIRSLNQLLEIRLSMEMQINNTQYKMKQINDPELADIHMKYLEQEIVFMDDIISRIISEINEVINGKQKPSNSSK